MPSNDRNVIAVVDDDDGVRESLEYLLEVCGHQVAGYASAAEFLAASDLHRVAGLILDQHMPKLTGLEMLARLRAQGWCRPVLLVTGSPSAEVSDRAANLGVRRVLEKPVSDELLFQFVDSLAA
ncbi:MAG TPA: response regulator [Acetobacteraceae bacterium]|jgi:two-component system response regulator FixJ